MFGIIATFIVFVVLGSCTALMLMQDSMNPELVKLDGQR